MTRIHKGFVCLVVVEIPTSDLAGNLSVQKDIRKMEQMLVLLKTYRKGLK
jgi:hypothetical protein